jgi:hypothetical protein
LSPEGFGLSLVADLATNPATHRGTQPDGESGIKFMNLLVVF